MKVTVHITETGETYDRDMTEAEIAQAELDLLIPKIANPFDEALVVEES